MSSAWDGLQNTICITQLPHYAINKSLPEDSFFTDRDVAKSCMSTFLRVCDKNNIDLKGYTYIEPSAGEGCFYDIIPLGYKKIGLDILPRNPNIEQADYLRWSPKIKSKYIVIGNPPFGVRGALALAFINRSFLFADVVAFILPMSFYSNGKGSNMSRVKGASLIHNEKLKSDAFYLPSNNKRMSVNTVFQIWQKGKNKQVFVSYDVSEYVDIYTCCSAPSRFCGLGRGRVYDCFVASTFYGKNTKIVHSFDEVNYGSGYGMIIKKDKQKILSLLKRADWGDYSSKATNHCRHIRMHHIRQYLYDNKIGTLN